MAKITKEFKTTAREFSVAENGNSFLCIAGHHINGLYIAITAALSLYENCRIDKLCSCNDYLHNRTYTPRKLTSLFTNKE